MQLALAFEICSQDVQACRWWAATPLSSRLTPPQRQVCCPRPTPHSVDMLCCSTAVIACSSADKSCPRCHSATARYGLCRLPLSAQVLLDGRRLCQWLLSGGTDSAGGASAIRWPDAAVERSCRVVIGAHRHILLCLAGNLRCVSSGLHLC